MKRGEVKRYVLTNSSSGSDKVSLFAGLALSSHVISGHPEGVLQTLNEPCAGVLGGFDNNLVSLNPQKAVPLLLLYAVTSDGASTIAAGTFPR